MKTAAKNLLSLLTADIVRRLLSFVSVAYLARVIGVEGFGAVNIGFAVLSIGIIVSAMGLGTLGAREIARGKSDDIVSDILSLRVILSAAAIALTAVIALLFVHDATTAKLIIVFSLSTFGYALLIEWYFQGKENMRIIAAGRVSSPALYVVLLLLFVRSEQQILWVAAAAVLSDFLYAFLLLRKYKLGGGTLEFRVRPAVWKSFLSESLPVALGYIFAQVTVNYPPLALAMLKSNTDVGIFSAASKIVFYLLMVDRVLAPLLLPALTRWQGVSAEVLAHRTSDTLRWLMLVGMPVAVGGTILARPIVSFVFGPEYLPAADVFRVFVWYFFLTMMNSVYSTSLLAIGQNSSFGYVMFISAAVYIVAVTSCTMWYGYIGTAFAVVFSEGITLVLLHARLKRFSGLIPPKSILKIITASALMAMVVGFSSSVHFLAVIVIGAIVYGVTVVGIRAVTPQEILQLVRKS
ncbi:MAG TPA: flippase [Bacteroidota bacterium]|nr:flippase [Bacteroidota bacterium]